MAYDIMCKRFSAIKNIESKPAPYRVYLDFCLNVGALLASQQSTDSLDHQVYRLNFGQRLDRALGITSPELPLPRDVNPTNSEGCEPVELVEFDEPRAIQNDRPLRHVRAYLTRLQAEESPEILGEDLGVALINQLNLPANAQMVTVRKALRCIGRPDLLQHAPLILKKATGCSPPHLNPEQLSRALMTYLSITTEIAPRRKQPIGFLLWHILDGFLTGDSRRILNYINLPGPRAMKHNLRQTKAAIAMYVNTSGYTN